MGGAITTNQKWIYEKLLLLRNHGITKKPNLLTKYDGPWYYEQSLLGFNYRLTDIQCALGISQLSKLEKFNKKRNYLVDIYKKQFINCNGISFQMAEKPIYSAYHLFVLLIDYKKFNISKRDFFNKLNYFGILPQVHYIPVYHQPYYKKKMPSINLSECEKFYSQAISLPLYPGLSKKDIVYISNTIKNILKIKK
jgi:dTDP-4-amino-4,6-dideoxygalactose transaminase